MSFHVDRRIDAINRKMQLEWKEQNTQRWFVFKWYNHFEYVCFISHKYAVNVVKTIYYPSCPLWISKDIPRTAAHLHTEEFFTEEFKWVQTIIYSQFRYISRVYVGSKLRRGMLSGSINNKTVPRHIMCRLFGLYTLGEIPIVKTETFMSVAFLCMRTAQCWNLIFAVHFFRLNRKILVPLEQYDVLKSCFLV